MNRLSPVVTVVVLLALAQLSSGMAIERVGPDTPERPTIAQPGWPKGIELPLRHRSRVYSIEVNGNENVYFKATNDEINELLEQFSKSRLRDHQVKLEIGPKSVQSFDKRSFDYNVSLHVLYGIALFMTSEKFDDQTLEPTLTIYLNPDKTQLEQIKLPANVIISPGQDVGVNTNRTIPLRKAWHGRVQFDDGDESTGIERGISTRITYWEKDNPDGIELGQVRRDGTFKVILSDQEHAAIEKGDAWLTVLAGNWLSIPKKDGVKFPVATLTQEQDKAQAQTIAAPKYYWGRVQFDDGSPPLLEPKPWAGAEIWVNFPFAGKADLDSEGYFQVYFEPEQFEKVTQRKVGKNIYIPNQENGSAMARETFPPELLSQDKAKAGVVKIRRPVYEKGK